MLSRRSLFGEEKGIFSDDLRLNNHIISTFNYLSSAHAYGQLRAVANPESEVEGLMHQPIIFLLQFPLFFLLFSLLPLFLFFFFIHDHKLLKGLTRGSMGFPAVGGLKPHPTHRWISHVGGLHYYYLSDCMEAPLSYGNG